MFHLLLDNAKKSLQSEYRLRVILVSLVGVLLLIIVAAVLLIPSSYLSHSREALVVEKSNELQTAKQSDESQNIPQLLQGYSQKMAVLAPPPAGAVTYSKLLSSLAAFSGQGVTLSTFVYANDPGVPFTITITGAAKDRQSLVAFSKLLENAALFSKVDIPTSDFASDSNIPFSIQLTGK